MHGNRYAGAIVTVKTSLSRQHSLQKVKPSSLPIPDYWQRKIKKIGVRALFCLYSIHINLNY
ncbi:MAG TPA: hypothetical protein PLN01_12040 [Spirochaetota bacterium]|nr:hypothetical protein [Spirochaetota bacterium]